DRFKDEVRLKKDFCFFSSEKKNIQILSKKRREKEINYETFRKIPNRKIFGISKARILGRYSMAKPTIVHETHFRKKHSKTEIYSKFFNLVRKKTENSKKGKSVF